jgi:hypothetical protein
MDLMSSSDAKDQVRAPSSSSSLQSSSKSAKPMAKKTKMNDDIYTTIQQSSSSSSSRYAVKPVLQKYLSLLTLYFGELSSPCLLD